MKMRAFISCLLFAALLSSGVLSSGTGSASSTNFSFGGVGSDRAFFLRFDTESAACYAFSIDIQREANQAMPLVTMLTEGTRRNVRGVAIDDWEGSGGFVEDTPENGAHRMVNVSAGGVSILRIREESGYDVTTPRTAFKLTSYGCYFEGAAPRSVWFSALTTAKTTKVIVNVSFFEHGEIPDVENFTTGDARATLTFSAASPTTYFRQLKDFDGVASYNGDLAGAGLASAGGADLKTRLHTTNGFAGGFYESTFSGKASILSYRGGQGEMGAGTDTVPLLSPPRMMMLSILGAPGEWTFRAHVYASPFSGSSLYLWGADIKTSNASDPCDRMTGLKLAQGGQTYYWFPSRYVNEEETLWIPDTTVWEESNGHFGLQCFATKRHDGTMIPPDTRIL